MNQVIWESSRPCKKSVKTKDEILRRKQEDKQLFNEIAYQELIIEELYGIQ